MAKKIINGGLKWILGFIIAVGGATIPGVIAYGRLTEKVSRIEIEVDDKADKELVATRLDHIHEELVEAKQERQAIMKKLDEIR